MPKMSISLKAPRLGESLRAVHQPTKAIRPKKGKGSYRRKA